MCKRVRAFLFGAQTIHRALDGFVYRPVLGFGLLGQPDFGRFVQVNEDARHALLLLNDRDSA
jgi:hypothetical protein